MRISESAVKIKLKLILMKQRQESEGRPVYDLCNYNKEKKKI